MVVVPNLGRSARNHHRGDGNDKPENNPPQHEAGPRRQHNDTPSK
jgi:hypothetical protein